jgi:hypothetical protein
MPPGQGLWLDDDQGASPVEPAGEPDQSETCGRGDALGLNAAFLIQRQLFAQEEVFGGERSWGAETEAKIAHAIDQERQ